MTVFQILKKYPGIDTDLLLAHALRKPREFLYMHSEKTLTRSQIAQFKKLVMRRKRGMPLAYLLGYKYFYELKFKVTKNVLIPRPETEWLVDRALKSVKPGTKILDLGTGSGCIAVSLAKNVNNKKVRIYAVDISPKALEVARSNAKAHKAKIKLLRSDLLSDVPEKFDLIIANLPYVPRKDYLKLKSNLRYEPKLALIGTESLYKKLFHQLQDQPKATVLLEMDPSSKKLFTRLLRASGRKLNFYKDLQGLWRYATIGPTK